MSPLSLGVPILWKVSEGFELWPLSWPGPGHSEAGPIHHRHLLLYLERGECVREREEGRIPPSHRPTSERERESVWCVCLRGCTSLGGRGVRTEKTDPTHSLTATGREESLPIGSASNRQKMFRVIFWSSQKVLKCCRVNLLPFISSFSRLSIEIQVPIRRQPYSRSISVASISTVFNLSKKKKGWRQEEEGWSCFCNSFFSTQQRTFDRIDSKWNLIDSEIVSPSSCRQVSSRLIVKARQEADLSLLSLLSSLLEA